MQVDKGVSRLSVHSQADFVEVCLFSPFTTSDNENIINYEAISRMNQLPFDQRTYRDFPRRSMWPEKKGAFVLGSRTRNNIRSPLYLTFLFLGRGSNARDELVA